MDNDTKLEAHIKIDNELAVRGWRRAMRFRAIRDISYFFAIRLAIVWIVISIVNAILDAGDLTGYHLAALAAVWVAASTHRYFEWYAEVGNGKGWEFNARLDGTGVTTNLKASAEAPQFHAWDSYKAYREFDDYLEIEHEDSNFSFIPKYPELTELIEFTKTKIPKRPGY